MKRLLFYAIALMVIACGSSESEKEKQEKELKAKYESIKIGQSLEEVKKTLGDPVHTEDMGSVVTLQFKEGSNQLFIQFVKDTVNLVAKDLVDFNNQNLKRLEKIKEDLEKMEQDAQSSEE